ncbi:glycosyltransferase family 1 protein [Jeotgalibaca caeni]|uniref:glycosyltransferase family 1 protein n=1 Tax=Jeotgalibaca caeni TaxID=3028623 RepID=UPI00237E84B1|nr:glycosyltransferase family 1 protein [Jeotgalibaca caeni]MDE1549883.1 glycosyltransferase family 1 protein [Jeotgalibaca caeni]
MEPIRILNVVGRMDRGGIESFIMNLYRNIDREKIQFDFLAHYGKVDADFNDEIKELGGRIYEMPVIKSTNRTYYTRVFQYRRALINFFKNHPEYRIVHGHMTNTASIYMPIAKKYGNVSCCISHSHLSQARKGLSGVVTNLLQKSLSSHATDLFACSENAASWIYSKRDIESGKVKIINNAINASQFQFDIDKRDKIKKELNLKGELVVGHVGRFFYEKNHDFLLDIFNELLKIETNSKLLLVGEGDLFNDIKEKAINLGIIDKIIFTGKRSDVSMLMQAMDVFVMPSHFEGLPLVSIEAQAAGLKCITSDVITDEIKITDLVSFLSLSVEPQIWAKKIMEVSKYNRRNTLDLIVQNGYDINFVANYMQKFYEEKFFESAKEIKKSYEKNVVYRV